ncbi:serine hydrolase domain-containing protein [Curtobacterium sp. 1P10AnD]|uniref:serine hydrolase domain-containing protein n=1 Tax=Curtobacterium sp. 1P10AnD TaxID=3132283 RepID=UPI0039A0CA2D
MVEQEINGSVASGYEEVIDAFRRVLRDEREPVDAQVAAYQDGRRVVDLWTGPETTADSLLGIYSASKGVTHLIVAMLVQDGVLDLDLPVATWWPEFAAGGKDRLLLRELLAHRAGLVGTPRGFTLEELSDDRFVARALEGRVPFWRPGSAAGYHALVVGALTGEVVRRATGRSVQELATDWFTKGLGVDVHLGTTEDQDTRFLTALPMTDTDERVRAARVAASMPNALADVAFNRGIRGRTEVWELPNHAIVRRRGTASLGGLGTARGLAELYARAAAGVGDKAPFLTPDTCAAFAQIQSVGPDLVLHTQKAWAVGFHAVTEQYPALHAGAFGHSGAGGQQALVDPVQALSYAFLRRRGVLPKEADAGHELLLSAISRAGRTVR